MQPTSRRFAPPVVESAQRQLVEFVAANPDVKLAVVTSGDGFEVAAHPHLPMAQRIAAMSSSLQALSEAMVNETGLAGVRNLVIEANGGTIIVLGVGQLTPRLSLTVVARGDETLGRLLWASRECCASVERRLLPALV